MNKTKDMDNHLKADTVIDFYAFSDKEHTLLPNDVSLADSEHSQPDTLSTGEYQTVESPSIGLECVDPEMQPPTEAADDSAHLESQESDQLHRPIWALPPEVRIASLLDALAKAQVEIERQAQRNRELNARMREISSLAGQPEERAAHDAEKNANLCARLDDTEDYLQVLTAQTGRLDSVLDSLTQPHTGVTEFNAALDEDLTGRHELLDKIQTDDGRLAELESLVDQLSGTDPSGNEVRRNAVEAEPAHVDFLETLADLHGKDRDKLTEVHLKDGEMVPEVDADNHLFIEMTDATKCPLNKSVMTIGRGRFNDIQIPTRCVSRSHARIVTNDSDAIIEDLNSKNGITVNGHSVKLMQLRNGDVVGLDKICFKFVNLTADDTDEADDRGTRADDAAGEPDQGMRDRRDRRNRRQTTRRLEQLAQRSRQDAEKQPDRETQSTKKPWWRLLE
jgi:pSer/pThr/pTyr-binding forkhead associated (FHA) protein